MLKNFEYSTGKKYFTKRYCDVGPCPCYESKPIAPHALHGGVMFLGDVSTGVAMCYRDFPETEFIEVCWSTE